MLLFHIHRPRIYIWADMRELSVRQDKVHEYSGRNVVADYFFSV